MVQSLDMISDICVFIYAHAFDVIDDCC